MNLPKEDLRVLLCVEWDMVRRCKLLVEDTQRCIGQAKALCTLSRNRLLQSKETLPLISLGDSESAERSH